MTGSPRLLLYPFVTVIATGLCLGDFAITVTNLESVLGFQGPPWP